MKWLSKLLVLLLVLCTTVAHSAINDDGTGDFLHVGSTPVAVATFSMGCWVKPTSTAVAMSIISINNGTATEDWSLEMLSAPSWRFRVSTAAGAQAATSPATPDTNLHYILAVEASATSHTIYVDGANSNTNAVSRAPTGAANLDIGSRSGGGQPANAIIGECAIWNVALTALEAADLAQGLAPYYVRPSALVFYLPMWNTTQLVDRMQGLTLTLNGNPTDGNHPRIFYPNSSTRPVANAAVGGGTNANSMMQMGCCQ